MRIQTLMFLALVAVASTACSRTALDNPAPGSSPCADKVLDGYLVNGWACQSPVSQGQRSASLPAYQSKEGLGCHLDVYLSERLPVTAIPEACSGEPFTSKCFLESTGFIDSASNGIAGYPRVSLVGSMQTTKVCTPIAKCAPMRPECEECQQQAIFVPCQVMAE